MERPLLHGLASVGLGLLYATKGANMRAVDITSANSNALLIRMSWTPRSPVHVSDSSLSVRESGVSILGKFTKG